METKVENILKAAVIGTNVPVINKDYPDVWPCITFHFYNENGALFGAGTATEEGASCQVDIWYNVKTDEVKLAVKNIKNALVKEKYFTYPTKESVYETDKKIYHTYFLFDLIESEE